MIVYLFRELTGKKRNSSHKTKAQSRFCSMTYGYLFTVNCTKFLKYERFFHVRVINISQSHGDYDVHRQRKKKKKYVIDNRKNCFRVSRSKKIFFHFLPTHTQERNSKKKDEDWICVS